MEKIKAAFIAIFTGINALLGTLAIPIYILVGLNFADYATGYTAAPYRGQQRRSSIGLCGIAKKICMWLLVGLGAVLDWLLAYSSESVGIALPVHGFFASLAAVWLIANEIISILENIADIGVELPPFLMTIAKWVKAGASKTGEKASQNDLDK
jgi:toxin secretion/phage lysis holin